jgi:hypothetical protein
VDPTLNDAPTTGALLSVYPLFWNQHRRRNFYTHSIKTKKCPALLGLDPNFEVVCAFGFLPNFCDILDFSVLDPNLNITAY